MTCRMSLVCTATAALGLYGATMAFGLDAASSEETKPEAAQERFALVETNDGVVRVDKLTGAVTFCRQSGSGMRCVLAADERQAWQAETEALSKQITVLKDRVAALETGRTGPAQPRAESDRGTSGSGAEEEGLFSRKTQKEIDQAVETAERVLRGLVGAMKDLRNDFSNDSGSN